MGSFIIRDRGYGIFRRIKNSFGLESEAAAVEHLLKGKQTTAPQAQGGQGIFFTSKIADVLRIRSGRYELTFDNAIHDIRLASTRPLIGTRVEFHIRKQTRKRLDKLFRDYANEDFEFDRTRLPIILLRKTGGISRSQARRLTIGLDKFDRIILDFEGVKEIGQGFTDELFRVFKQRHPSIVLEPIHMSPAVEFMVRRAIAGAEDPS